jgi:predicted RNase H-like nuclease (RuvC/YqgF family)
VTEDAANERIAEHPLDAELRRANSQQQESHPRAKPRPPVATPTDAAVALVDRLKRQSAEIADLKRAAARLQRQLVDERRLRRELEQEHAGVVRIADALEAQLEEAWSRLQAAQREQARRRPPWRSATKRPHWRVRTIWVHVKKAASLPSFWMRTSQT